jgi:AcrR family transcriptional regulator
MTEPSLTRVQKRQQATRERIFRIAIEFFLNKGMDETTVAEISEAADIGKGTFFSYFPTKESIVVYLGQILTISMLESARVARAQGSNIQAILEAFFKPSLHWHQSNRALSRYVMLAATRNLAAMHDKGWNLDELFTSLVAFLREGQEKGEFSTDFQAEDAALLIYGTYFTSLHRWHIADNSTDLDQIFFNGLKLVYRGLYK